MGVILLDLDEPEHVLSALPEPLLTADQSERYGYVPNVAYSCGALLHGQTVVLPYACSDSSVRIATVDLPAIRPSPVRPGQRRLSTTRGCQPSFLCRMLPWLACEVTCRKEATTLSG